MDAYKMKLGQLFNPKSQRSFITAFDRGLGADVSGGGENTTEIINAVIASSAEGILISPGMLDQNRAAFAHNRAPAILLRCDFLLLGNLQPNGLSGNCEEYRTLVSGAEAQAMGADAMVLFLVLGYSNDATTANNAQSVARAAREAHAVGLPVIVEVVLWGSRVQDQCDTNALTYACRLASELGADAVKTQYTGSVETMRKVINNCPVPVLLLGGPKCDNDRDFIKQTREALSSGVRGMVYGRNVWQAPDPAKMAKKLHDIIHNT